jgi:chorismate mutase
LFSGRGPEEGFEVTVTLDGLRTEIDALDGKIVALLAQRLAVASRVAEIKRREGIPVRLQDRIDTVLDRVSSLAKENGAEPEAIRAIYESLIETTCLYEEARIGNSAG